MQDTPSDKGQKKGQAEGAYSTPASKPPPSAAAGKLPAAKPALSAVSASPTGDSDEAMPVGASSGRRISRRAPTGADPSLLQRHSCVTHTAPAHTAGASSSHQTTCQDQHRPCYGASPSPCTSLNMRPDKHPPR